MATEAHEELREMGRLYIEREKVEQQLGAIQTRLRGYRDACERAVAALDGRAAWRRASVDGNVAVVFPDNSGKASKENEGTFPGAADILEALELRERLQKRLTELNAFFEGRRRR